MASARPRAAPELMLLLLQLISARAKVTTTIVMTLTMLKQNMAKALNPLDHRAGQVLLLMPPP